MYVKIENNKPVEWPVYDFQIKSGLKNVSFPRGAKAESFAPYGYEPFVEEKKPVFDKRLYSVKEVEPEKGDSGEWFQKWGLEPLFSAEEMLVKEEQFKVEDAAERVLNERQAIKERRDKAISSGTTYNGMTIATDDLSQQRITGAALAATIDNTITVQWKLDNGTFVVLDAATVIAIAQAVRAHVQACFDREAELLTALNAGEEYDIEAGWPNA